eukprot:gnl/MRDRNA2_/MRDRNA2_90316_c0_seq1.p1 gnl/MRDRNA2_/MRDRNA2_90316_c0~~gnl/MRDRNA2_/MRDRNA2_90316_c0_seq1.p1  ORF type:complete len:606 (-),score=92.01 gnl/MRDRNA2_/MRDRNA2_90316_c0_seq1:529-2277(-)
MTSTSAEEQQPLRFCIIGAGSIGGMMGAFLAHAGFPVTFVDVPGPHLDAMKNQGGIRLITAEGKEIFGQAQAFANMEEVGKVDCVVLALKANTLPLIVGSLPSLLHDNTMVVTIQNGIPFWYFLNHGGEHANKPIQSVDPEGMLISTIDAHRLIGCIAYPAAHILEPGLIKHVEGTRFPVGELDGSNSARLCRLASAFNKSGLKSPQLIGDIKDPKGLRAETWLKLWGNLCFNPISALTHTTLETIATCQSTKQLCMTAMEEAQAVASKLGIRFRTSIEKRVEGAAKVGKHKTSMLQDVEAGRITEVDSMVGSVCELGELVGVPTPSISALYACMQLVNTKIKEEKTRIVSFVKDEYYLKPFQKEEEYSLMALTETYMVVRAPDRLGLLRDITTVVARNKGNIGICKTLMDGDIAVGVLLAFEAPADKVQHITKELNSMHGVSVEISDSDYRIDHPVYLPSNGDTSTLASHHKPQYRVLGAFTDRPGVLKTLAGLLMEHELNIDVVATHRQMVPVCEDRKVAAFMFEAQVHSTRDIDKEALEEQVASACRTLGGTLEFQGLIPSSTFVSSNQISAVPVRSRL